MTNKQRLFYVEVNDSCGIEAGSNAQTVRRGAAWEYGGANVKVRLATQVDVDWVRGMGGYVPDGRIAKTKEVQP